MLKLSVRNLRLLGFSSRGGHLLYFRALTSQTQPTGDAEKVEENLALEHESKGTPAESNEKSPSDLKPQELGSSHLSHYRFVYPEFLPDPRFEFRNKIREKIERSDMLKRRSMIDIPEFYVGSVLAVTASDPYAPGKVNRFVGICIHRTYVGLRATFTLRNVVDKQGVEIMYDMYNPTIQKIEVLKLEKRLDDELFYLRDSPPEYSTFPFDMEPELIVEGEPVRVNPVIVPLKPRPWVRRWERHTFKGVVYPELPEKVWKRAQKSITPHPEDKYDLMKEYRLCIPEEDQVEIWQDVDAHKQQFQLRKQLWKQKVLLKAPPKK